MENKSECGECSFSRRSNNNLEIVHRTKSIRRRLLLKYPRIILSEKMIRRRYVKCSSTRTTFYIYRKTEELIHLLKRENRQIMQNEPSRPNENTPDDVQNRCLPVSAPLRNTIAGKYGNYLPAVRNVFIFDVLHCPQDIFVNN